MTTNKWFTAIFSIAILIALIFTVQGISANADLTKTSASSQAILNASSARWSGLAGRAAAEIVHAQRINSAQAARLNAVSEDYVARLVRVNSAQAARLTAIADFYTARTLKINTALSNRLSAMADFYTAKKIKVSTAQSGRLTAMAEFYAGKVSQESHTQAVRLRVMPDTFTRFVSVQRVRNAESARWSGMAAKYFAEH
jgi:hypothetical protein